MTLVVTVALRLLPVLSGNRQLHQAFGRLRAGHCTGGQIHTTARRASNLYRSAPTRKERARSQVLATGATVEACQRSIGPRRTRLGRETGGGESEDGDAECGVCEVERGKEGEDGACGYAE